MIELKGEGFFNLNVLKEVHTTKDFRSLDSKVKGCQHYEDYGKCISNELAMNILKNCNCLPFEIRLDEKVFHFQMIDQYSYHLSSK